MPVEAFSAFGAGVPAMLPLTMLLLPAALAHLGVLRRLAATRLRLMITHIVLLVDLPLEARQWGQHP